jgi:hypothetical protein
LGVVSVRDNQVFLVSPETGTVALLGDTVIPVDEVVISVMDGVPMVMWLGDKKIAWQDPLTLKTTVVDVPDHGTVGVVGDGVMVSSADDHQHWILTGGGFTPITVSQGATVLGMHQGSVFYTNNGVTLLSARADGVVEVLSLTPPETGFVPTRLVSASWGHSLSLWQSPDNDVTVAVIHSLPDGELVRAWSTTSTWVDPSFSDTRLTVTSGSETVWMAGEPQVCHLGTTGVITDRAGGVLAVSTATGVGVFQNTCVVSPSTMTPVSSTPDGSVVIMRNDRGSYQGSGGSG